MLLCKLHVYETPQQIFFKSSVTSISWKILVESFKMVEGFQFDIDKDNDMLVETVAENNKIQKYTWTVS